VDFYRVYDVTGATTDRPETLGTKEKFWLMPSPGMELTIIAWLFKIGRPNTGENWAEKACCEILRHLKMPCATYEFAKHKQDQGVISQQFVSANTQFVPANMLLESVVRGYDGTLTFRQRKYQVSTPFNLIKARSIIPPLKAEERYSNLSAAEMFVGYLLFDVLVGNTDRHAENWGVIVDYSDRYNPGYSLSPTFDHASSLGRELSDDARRRRLTTPDVRGTVAAYCDKARSAFYGPKSTKTMLQSEVIEELIRLEPKALSFWARTFSDVPSEVYRDIFHRIDPGLISQDAIEFSLAMLAYNSKMIRQHAL
jgi:HipA-like protein